MIHRCEECGSWGVECGNEKPIRDCGCARCLAAVNAELIEAQAMAMALVLSHEEHIAKLNVEQQGIQHLLNTVNAVTAPHRHGQFVSKRRLDNLANAQIDYESIVRKARGE